ncbi:MAG: carboxymuconolactone decarboxylase family protein [Candidatus Rokubacteria bacterium]|nr:carboxymuconolactone decarboxylase family protein [Candidatus Rokubacteria bacterium]
MPGDRLSRPRIAPLPLADWDPELRARFEKPGGLGRILNVMGTLANHPALFRRWVIFANHFLFKSTLAARAREIVILRTAWLAGCAYEWGQHLEIAAADAAFGEPEFSALAEGAAAPLWRPADAALIRAADGLYVDAGVDDATWEALRAHYDERQVLDVVFMAGNYLTLAMALNAFGVQLDEGSRGFRPGLPVNARRPSPTLPPMEVRHATPRLSPLPDAALAPDQRELLAKARGPLASVNVLETVVRHPDLLRRWLPFFNHVLHKSTLPARDRELLILRVGRLCGAAYEWAQHVPWAERAGLVAAEIHGVAAGADAAVWSDAHDRALLRAADQLHRETMLDAAAWTALAARYGTEQLIDVVFTVGQYRLVSAALNTLGVQLDAYLRGYPGVQ